MRSLPELQAAATIAFGEDALTGSESREELMDMLRSNQEHDKALQIDPMKAKDLKAEIDWGKPNPFAKIGQYLTGDHVLEPKLDGARMRIHVLADGVKMTTGRRSTVTYAYIERQENFPHIAEAASLLPIGTVLDGEIMAPSAKIPTRTKKKGIQQFTNSMLNAAVALTNVEPAWSVATQKQVGWCTFWAFDIMALGGEDLTKQPLHLRRKFLESAVETMGCENIKTTPQFEANAENIQLCLDKGFEGSMIKTKSGTYEAGKRSKFWLKVKTMSTADAFITGWQPGEGRNEGKVGAFLVSVYDDLGLEVEIAKVGAIDDALRDSMTADFESYRGKCVEVMAQGKTKNGRLRHPQLVQFRPDKDPKDCDLAQLDPFPEC